MLCLHITSLCKVVTLESMISVLQEPQIVAEKLPSGREPSAEFECEYVASKDLKALDNPKAAYEVELRISTRVKL